MGLSLRGPFQEVSWGRFWGENQNRIEKTKNGFETRIGVMQGKRDFNRKIFRFVFRFAPSL